MAHSLVGYWSVQSVNGWEIILPNEKCGDKNSILREILIFINEIIIELVRPQLWSQTDLGIMPNSVTLNKLSTFLSLSFLI